MRTERLILRDRRESDLEPWAAMNADPDIRPNAMLRGDVARNGLHMVADAEGCFAGANRRICDRNGRSEERHDAVPGQILHRALMFAHDGDPPGQDGLHQRERLLVADAFGERHRACNVCEQHGRRVSLTLRWS